ncbi:hypothetical protein N9993_00130 [bacterium]|jgi:hypothetical protein|nr:hypothetical protein [bacterium]MDC3339381.1 hypothetical protein [Planktomarina temperata]
MTVKLETRVLPKRNPFSVAKIQNLMERSQDKDLYEDLATRTNPTKTPPTQKLITDAINALRSRVNGTYTVKDFGGIEFVAFELLDINVDNQRDVDWDHVAHIIESFDPRAVQVVNSIKLPNGRYSIPEGQHTAVALYILWMAGMIEKDFKVACKVVDALAVVPGSDTKGEAFGNFLFRLINYKGRKAVEPYFMHKSRVSGVRNYGSTLTEDLHAERIQSVVEQSNMYTRPAVEARGQGAKPGMVTYISGLNKISEMESENFDVAINDLEFALSLHNQYFANEKGVDGGFILALGRYAKLARKSKTTITREWQDALMQFFKTTYASPSKFHKQAKNRLEKFNRSHDLPGGWSDNCLLSILILDFYAYCDANDLDFPILPDQHINKYNGI